MGLYLPSKERVSMNPEDDCVSCFLGVVDSLTRTSLMKNIGRKKKKKNQGSIFPLACLWTILA